MFLYLVVNVFGIHRNHYLNQEAVPKSNTHITLYVQLEIIDLAQKGGAQAPFTLPLPMELKQSRNHRKTTEKPVRLITSNHKER